MSDGETRDSTGGDVEDREAADTKFVQLQRALEESEAQLGMARERLRRVRVFAEGLPWRLRDDLRLVLGPEFDDVEERP